MVKIPVYEISVSGYMFNLNKNSVDNDMMEIPFGVKIPRHFELSKPDFIDIGKQIDKILKKHFLNKNVAIRALGSCEHPGKTVDELVDIIKETGHDRYDPERKGDRYDNIENKRIDFFALPFFIDKKGEYTRHLVEPFYYWPIHQQGKPVKIDILIIYDLFKLKTVEHRYYGREDEVKTDGFVFIDENNKPEAILGIIKIR